MFNMAPHNGHRFAQEGIVFRIQRGAIEPVVDSILVPKGKPVTENQKYIINVMCLDFKIIALPICL